MARATRWAPSSCPASRSARAWPGASWAPAAASTSRTPTLGRPAGAQAATVAATRPVPARAAPRRKPRRVREASSPPGSVVSGSGEDGGRVPWGVGCSMVPDGRSGSGASAVTFGPFAVGRASRAVRMCACPAGHGRGGRAVAGGAGAGAGRPCYARPDDRGVPPADRSRRPPRRARRARGVGGQPGTSTPSPRPGPRGAGPRLRCRGSPRRGDPRAAGDDRRRLGLACPPARDGVARCRRRASAPRGAARRHAGATGRSSGTLWLDAPAIGADLAVRAMELALAGARDRDAADRAGWRLEALDEAIRAMSRRPGRRPRPAGDRRPGARPDGRALRGPGDPGPGRRRSSSSSPAGIGRAERARIGAPPRGHGILGLIIRENRTIRLDDLMADPRAARLPAEPSRDAPVPRRADRGPGPDDRQPVPDREGRRLHGRGPADRRVVRPPRRDRHGQRPAPRAGPAPGHRRGARADREGPPRQRHPGDLRGRPLPRRRPRDHGRGARRGPQRGSSGRSTASTRRSATSATSSSACARRCSTASTSWRASPPSPTSSGSTR